MMTNAISETGLHEIRLLMLLVLSSILAVLNGPFRLRPKRWR